MIDIMLFYKTRFLRLWPALFVYEFFNIFTWAVFTDKQTYQAIKKDIWLWTWKDLLFINNLEIGKLELGHTWSIAVEFQFYLISPFIVKLMYKSRRPWVYPLLIIIIATLCRLMDYAYYLPGSMTQDNFWTPGDDPAAFVANSLLWEKKIYF